MGSDYVDWEVFNKHVSESNAGFNRLTAVETQMDNTVKEVDDMRHALKEVERTVWKASGAMIAILVAVELLIKLYRG